MEKINVAELLKDCPKDMELDCTMLDKVILDGVDNSNDPVFPIRVRRKDGCLILLTKYGQYFDDDYAKCVIFPKGKTTWEGFIPPCKFKDGDVLFVDCADKESDGDVYKYIFILKEIDSLGNYFSYCHLSIDGFFSSSQYLSDNRYIPRLATEEEKAQLFQAIKDNGYKWNPESKTLEKVIEPKFDITTLKPFDKVLVRSGLLDRWRMQFFEKYDETDKYPFICMWHNKYNQCVPYEGNEHLLGTTDDCDKYFKTWE